MPKFLKWSLIVLGLVLGLTILALLVFKYVYNPLEMSDKKKTKYFSDNDISVKISQISMGDVRLQTTITENIYHEDSTLICFIHGAPGSGMDFKKYLLDKDLLSRSRMMVVDRSGYGNSSDAHRNIEEQAHDIMKAINETAEYKRLILVGHSYGCAISSLMSIEYPDLISDVVLLAPVLDPFNETVFWYAKLGNSKLISWMLNQQLSTGIFEKVNHKEHLLALHNKWDELKVPTYMLYGMKDTYLAPYNNVEYAEKEIPKVFFEIELFEEGGHLIPFLQYSKVKETIISRF